MMELFFSLVFYAVLKYILYYGGQEENNDRHKLAVRSSEVWPGRDKKTKVDGLVKLCWIAGYQGREPIHWKGFCCY